MTGTTDQPGRPEGAAARYDARELHAFAAEALQRAGARPEDAHLVADGLVAADLRGVHTHGVLRAGIYVARLRHRSFAADAALTVVRARGPIVVLDAGAGLGIAMATRAMDRAVGLARTFGVGIAAVRNSSHCGMLAHLALRPVAEGMIGIALSNADAQVAPWGARAKFLGTNPLAIAVPAGTCPPIVLDMATSVVPHSRIQAAAQRGEPIPVGWALDEAGRDTTDPAAALRGALLPFGGAKGSALSIMIDLLGGLLAGARSGPEITPLYEDLDRPQGVGHLLAALSVEAFVDPAEFAARVEAFVRAVRGLPPAEGVTRVYLPGEIEHERAVAYARDGIPLPPYVERAVAHLAAELGIPAPRPRS